SINFSSSTSIRVLNQALLHVYFDLQVTLPQENLCPIVLNRLNYLRWIQHYILSDFPFCDPKGLDIGTGASCIYPLLGARAIPGSSFIATDISPESVAVAQDNIERNALESRIHLYLNPDRTTTLPLDAPGFPSLLMFSMCNPPFYASSEERMRLKGAKVQEPVLDANGKDEELFTEGGEQAFLQGMVDESQKWGARIKWYTTMVGRKSTLAEVKARIRAAGARQVREGTLVQGRTTRWVLAWSFLDK
ncbi:ribosomal RNA large subunit methyltransferase F-like protein, partial [Kickxella alabastrina]|uniref:ribosomal RNA large subunit methyltransferase F-like protein n=1 Tax=Kickxella alabastrina TaxID=61397 RepID=UPI0022207F21